jgi:hypothetical protein
MVDARKDTRRDLVSELGAVLESTKDEALAARIRVVMAAAEAGEFHDARSEHAGTICQMTGVRQTHGPKVAAIVALRAIGQTALAKRVDDGEFDEVSPEQRAPSSPVADGYARLYKGGNLPERWATRPGAAPGPSREPGPDQRPRETSSPGAQLAAERWPRPPRGG